MIHSATLNKNEKSNQESREFGVKCGFHSGKKLAFNKSEKGRFNY